jgi:hypothetical protein
MMFSRFKKKDFSIRRNHHLSIMTVPAGRTNYQQSAEVWLQKNNDLAICNCIDLILLTVPITGQCNVWYKMITEKLASLELCFFIGYLLFISPNNLLSSVHATQHPMGKSCYYKWLLEKDLATDMALVQDILSEFVLRSQENYGNLIVTNPPDWESKLTPLKYRADCCSLLNQMFHFFPKLFLDYNVGCCPFSFHVFLGYPTFLSIKYLSSPIMFTSMQLPLFFILIHSIIYLMTLRILTCSTQSLTIFLGILLSWGTGAWGWGGELYGCPEWHSPRDVTTYAMFFPFTS